MTCFVGQEREVRAREREREKNEREREREREERERERKESFCLPKDGGDVEATLALDVHEERVWRLDQTLELVLLLLQRRWRVQKVDVAMQNHDVSLSCGFSLSFLEPSEGSVLRSLVVARLSSPIFSFFLSSSLFLLSLFLLSSLSLSFFLLFLSFWRPAAAWKCLETAQPQHMGEKQKMGFLHEIQISRSFPPNPFLPKKNHDIS